MGDIQKKRCRETTWRDDGKQDKGIRGNKIKIWRWEKNESRRRKERQNKGIMGGQHDGTHDKMKGKRWREKRWRDDGKQNDGQLSSCTGPLASKDSTQEFSLIGRRWREKARWETKKKGNKMKGWRGAKWWETKWKDDGKQKKVRDKMFGNKMKGDKTKGWRRAEWWKTKWRDDGGQNDGKQSSKSLGRQDEWETKVPRLQSSHCLVRRGTFSNIIIGRCATARKTQPLLVDAQFCMQSPVCWMFHNGLRWLHSSTGPTAPCVPRVPQVPQLSVPHFGGRELHQGQSQRLKPNSVAAGDFTARRHHVKNYQTDVAGAVVCSSTGREPRALAQLIWFQLCARLSRIKANDRKFHCVCDSTCACNASQTFSVCAPRNRDNVWFSGVSYPNRQARTHHILLHGLGESNPPHHHHIVGRTQSQPGNPMLLGSNSQLFNFPNANTKTR